MARRHSSDISMLNSWLSWKSACISCNVAIKSRIRNYGHPDFYWQPYHWFMCIFSKRYVPRDFNKPPGRVVMACVWEFPCISGIFPDIYWMNSNGDGHRCYRYVQCIINCQIFRGFLNFLHNEAKIAGRGELWSEIFHFHDISSYENKLCLDLIWFYASPDRGMGSMLGLAGWLGVLMMLMMMMCPFTLCL